MEIGILFNLLRDFIGAGSDDGYFWIWNRFTTNIERIYKADESIVNCVQPNLITSLIATSGIDSTIKLWEPLNDDYENDPYLVSDAYEAMKHNQKQMNAHPFEFLFANLPSSLSSEDWYDEDNRQERRFACNTS